MLHLFLKDWLAYGPRTALEVHLSEKPRSLPELKAPPKEFGFVWVCSRYGPRDPRSNQAPGPILEPT